MCAYYPTQKFLLSQEDAMSVAHVASARFRASPREPDYLPEGNRQSRVPRARCSASSKERAGIVVSVSDRRFRIVGEIKNRLH